ncbi:helix-turn-helix transcriptional regulator [Jannaschia sp. Os4]|uniref:helix-turn-helix transcriptional regulator n=1 Tax=Jannaschia sp. Os4 TaxID=2807617 RepID=UPI00193A9112|nr:LuxR C-terminal-related transcriptional regulator [Jannaschia sp. Os4]MBM2576771.1 helix-turn-helix transcriptional regulator [Jannaschia sp. Os4]
MKDTDIASVEATLWTSHPSTTHVLASDARVDAIAAAVTSAANAPSITSTCPVALSAAAKVGDVVIVDATVLPDPVLDGAEVLDSRDIDVVLVRPGTDRFPLVEARRAVRCAVDWAAGAPVGLREALASLLLPGGRPVPILSARERAVIRLYVLGHSFKRIGAEIGISPKSAETYKRRACAKFGLVGRADALAYFMPARGLTAP